MEKHLFVVSVLFLFFLKLNAQNDISKWRNESAVILLQEFEYSYEGKTYWTPNGTIYSLDYDEKIHKKIKLQDKLAIEQFSEFYFKTAGKDKSFKVIKANGEEVIVILANTIPVSLNEVPRIFKSHSLDKQFEYSKIAIPNLEIGDIIEFSCSMTKSNRPISPYFIYPEVLINLKDQYPILNEKITFKIDRANFINIRCLNGAPDLQEIQNTDTKIRRFYVEMKDVDPYRREIWQYNYLTEPMIRFQSVFGKEGARKDNLEFYFMPEKSGMVKTSADIKEIAKSLNNIFSIKKKNLNYKIVEYAEYILNEMKTYNKTVVNQEEYLQKAFYIFRQKALDDENDKVFPTFEMYQDSKNKKMDFSEIIFVHVWKLICEKRKWNYAVGIGVPRNIGSVEKVISFGDFTYFILVGDKPIFCFNEYSKLSSGVKYLEGTQAFILVSEKGDYSGSALKPALVVEEEKYKMYQITLPTSLPKDNTFKHYFTLTFDLDKQIINTTDSAITKGYGGDYNQEEVFYNVPLWQNEHEITGLPEMVTVEKVSTTKNERANARRLEKERKANELVSEAEKAKNELMKQLMVEDEYNIDRYLSFSLVSDGRSEKYPERIYIQKFDIKEFVHKVGPNYIFDVGKMIGHQIKLKPEELSRNNDIFFNYVKTCTYQINFEVPKGYTISGLDKIKANLNNENCSLTINSIENAGKVSINVIYDYKKLKVERANWDDIVELLKTIEAICDAKIAFKKN